MNAPQRAPDPHRSRPRMLPTVAAVAGIALFVCAGQWQHRRMAEKEALRAQFDAASAAAASPLPADAAVDWTAWRYRPVVADGTFDAPRQILIDNRIENGRAGYHVVTPLRMTDGRTVLVDRGWVAAGETRAQLPTAAPPTGMVSVHARVNIPARYVELSDGAPAGPVWENLDPARVAKATGVALLPIVLEQTTPLNTGDDLVRAWPAPDFGIERHRIYMVQWYLFAALAAGLWLWFHVRRPRATDPQ